MKRRTCLQSLLLPVVLGAGRYALADVGNTFRTAIIRDNYQVVRELLQQGVDPNWRDARGTPALVQALQQESWRVAQELLRAPRIQLDAASPAGESALMLACIKGQLALVQQLLAQGAGINHPGWTPLHYVASADLEHSVEIARLLLEQYAYVDAESPNRTTPLMLAAQYGSQAMVELLLEAGADVQLRNQQGLSAVDFAKRSGREFMVQIVGRAFEATRRSKASW